VDEINNDITLLAFKLLVKDLLALFTTVNEGVINVLDQYFEMSKIDAKDALQIYKTFCKQTERVVDYLGAAKKIPHLEVNIPNLKHVCIYIILKINE
jgi:phosphatidylinositol-binding clathrin assembly protein